MPQSFLAGEIINNKNASIYLCWELRGVGGCWVCAISKAQMLSHGTILWNSCWKSAKLPKVLTNNSPKPRNCFPDKNFSSGSADWMTWHSFGKDFMINLWGFIGHGNYVGFQRCFRTLGSSLHIELKVPKVNVCIIWFHLVDVLWNCLPWQSGKTLLCYLSCGLTDRMLH